MIEVSNCKKNGPRPQAGAKENDNEEAARDTLFHARTKTATQVW
jgi:hypothetical protein